MPDKSSTARPDPSAQPMPASAKHAWMDMEVPVTRSFLPPLEEYTAMLAPIWKSGWITNRGPYVTDLESRLRAHLGAEHLFIMSNGTLAIQLAIKALGITGEVVVTPFSYVATVSSAVWEGCTPVFADIDPVTLTIDPAKVERAITPRTTAILATHVFGNPCDVEALQAIADRHGLKVIYDGAHSFGVNYKGRPIGDHGDVTTLSFHATKLFHTVEGGAVIARTAEVGNTLSYMRNFGHAGPDAFQGIGINAKMSEPHAIMGHLVLDRIAGIIATRRGSWEAYANALSDRAELELMSLRPGTEFNYAYFPVVFDTEARMLRVQAALLAQRIHGRRYFHPSLDTLPYVAAQECPVSRSVASRILCLPLYAYMEEGLVDRIAAIVKAAL